MGEDPEKIFPLGAPGLDHIFRGNLLDREAILAELGIVLAEGNSKDIVVVTYHPVTLEASTAEHQMANLLEALSGRGCMLVFTYANADTGGRVINQMIDRFIKIEPHAYAFPSLGQRRYLSLLRAASGIVGNSSSGLIEASALKVPAVNIGDRQRGRVRAANVIDCGVLPGEIRGALDLALRPGFKESLRDMVCPYGTGEVSPRIVSLLKEIPLGEGLLKKRFWDWPCASYSSAP